MNYDTATCEELLAFIKDPATDPVERAAAQSAYDSRCGAGAASGESGGGGHEQPPQ